MLFGVEPFSTKLRISNIKNYKYDWYWLKNTTSGFCYAKHQPMRKIENICVFYNKKTPKYKPQGLQKLENPKFKKQVENYNQAKGSVYKRDLYNGCCQVYTGYPNHVLEFKKDSKCVHPTQKPVELLEYLIRTYTDEDDVVLDNCMGSGSTGVACRNTNRQFIGIEKNYNYYLTSIERIETK